MTTEEKAMALVNEVQEFDCDVSIYHVHNAKLLRQALCRAIEQHEAFRREVSNAVANWKDESDFSSFERMLKIAEQDLFGFIITKPDPLVRVINEVIYAQPHGDIDEVRMAHDFRAALDARGLEIREKNDGQPNSN